MAVVAARQQGALLNHTNLSASSLLLVVLVVAVKGLLLRIKNMNVDMKTARHSVFDRDSPTQESVSVVVGFFFF